MRKKKPVVLKYQTDVYSALAHNAPKSSTYRQSLEPSIGKTVTLCGTYERSSKRWCGKKTGYVRTVLLKNVVVNNGKRTDHIWLHIPKHSGVVQNELKMSKPVKATGVLYEYVCNGYRNIGIRVLNCKHISNTEVNK